MAETHQEVVKVWIEPGCIVCDSCETDCPEVFDVQEETCVIRPEAQKDSFTRPLTPSIIEAAEGCPVDVIKFDTVEVEGEAPWAGQEEEAAAAPAGGEGSGGAAKPKKAGWEPPEGPPHPQWAGLLETAHASAGRSAGGAAVKMQPTAKAPAEAVARAVPAVGQGAPDAVSAIAIGSGYAQPREGAVQKIRRRAAKLAGAATMTRRGFNWLIAIGSGALAFTGALYAGALQSFMIDKAPRSKDKVFRAGKLSDFLEPGVYEQHKKEQQTWIINLGGDKIVALSTICTHLGCIPNWQQGDQKFKCPCHGSGFYKDGVNFEGPAPRPLERYRIYLEGEYVMVDKSLNYRQELGQWNDSNSFVTI